jgi:hypothetical protein
MAELSTNQKAFIKTMTEDEEYERRGFELLLKRADFDIFFDELAAAGLFYPSRNLGPVPADQPGYYRLPYWNPLAYLEAAAKRAGEQDDLALAEKVMNVVRQVTRWRDEHGNVRDNENTWHAFATIFGLVPLQAVSLEDIDLIPAWLDPGFSQSRVGSAFARGPLRRFVDSPYPEDWQKACRILYHCTAIRRARKKQIDEGISERATTVVDDFWLKKLVSANASALGAKAGKEAAGVFLTRLRDLFAQENAGRMTYLLRPAIEDHRQNHSYRGPQNCLVEGLRNVLLGWVDHDAASASSFNERLLTDDSEIVRRIAIHLVDARFEALRSSVPLLLSPEIFDMGHLHELYVLLKDRFQLFTEEEKAATLNAIREIRRPNKGDDSERLQRSGQRRWLSAVAGHGYEPADKWFQELVSDHTLGGISPYPDFHMYVESRWGFGPTPHGFQELVAYAEDGNLIEKLNAFIPRDSWNGPTTRSLSDSLVEAVGFAPKIFLARLSSFLTTKRAYQYSIIAGFKKLWDAWDGETADFNWCEAWPKLIEFFEAILGNDHFWTETVAEDGTRAPNRDWIPSIISEFLRAGTRTDERAYAPDLLPRTWSLIKILLKKSEAQHKPSECDALNYAINTSKGKAIEALFDHALRCCRVSDAATGSHAETWQQDMLPVFDEELAACRDGNFEFSALAGAYLANLQYMNAEWCDRNIPKIFPIEFPSNCLSALDGLAFAPATQSIYRSLVDTGVLLWALTHEMKGACARENLVQRICLAYLRGDEELQWPRFAYLFDARRVDDLETASKYFWMIRDEPLSDDLKDRILLFWGQCVTWSHSVRPLPTKLFSTLSLLSCYLNAVGPRELELLLAVAPHVSIDYNADFFVEELDRLEGINPRAIASVLSTLLQSYQPVFDFEDRLKKLVTKLAARPETRADTLQCVNRLRFLPGMVQLYSQIAEPTPTSES